MLGLIAPMTLHAADPKDSAAGKTFAVPRHGGLELSIPKGWNDNIKLDKSGAYATVDYLVPDVGGQSLHQKNVNVYIARESVWIDVHLSKVRFTEKDQPLFHEAVKGIRFEKPAVAKPKSEMPR